MHIKRFYNYFLDKVLPNNYRENITAVEYEFSFGEKYHRVFFKTFSNENQSQILWEHIADFF